MNDVGGAARLRRIHVAKLEPHVVDHGEPAQARRVARAEVAVHVVPGESRVFQRSAGGLGVELSQRLVVGFTRGMLVDPSDIGLALDGHARLIL